MNNSETCKICGSETKSAGKKQGKYFDRKFEIRQCLNCFFSYVSNPWLDYKRIYDSGYYRGLGADPTVDYIFELENPDKTIRQYEWRGIYHILDSIVNIDSGAKWLDYGCGNGGLVRYCQTVKHCNITGFEEGWIKETAVKQNIPIIDLPELNEMKNEFDIITAIEVIEHVVNPVDVISHIYSLLKPGGVFFFTTGNAKPFRGNLMNWPYVMPEVHISFFEPSSIEIALKKAGFRVEYKNYLPGFSDVIRFKVLKGLGFRKTSILEKILPWPILSRVVDKKYNVTGHPVGISDCVKTDNI